MNIRHYCLSIAMLSHVAFVSPAVAQPAKYAICVGVNKYEHQKLVPLNYAVADARDMATLFRELKYDVIELTDETSKRPDKATIEAEVTRVIRGCRAGDVVVLCFAGHGLQFEGNKTAYFCPRDARPFKNETATLVSLTDIYEQLDHSFAGVKVMLIDACRDDPDQARGTRGGATSDSTPPPRGVAALFSCSAGQRAFEHPSIKHGIFFHYVLEGLKGNAANSDREISFHDLSSFVMRRVSRNVKTIVGSDVIQSPNAVNNISGESPVLAVVTAIPDRDTSRPAMKKSTDSSSPPAPPAAETGLARSVKSEACGMEFVLIDAGEFMMGSPDSETGVQDREKPQHKVRITKPFYLGKYEVTQGEWKALMGTEPWSSKDYAKEGTRYPASFISQEDAKEFAKKLSERDGAKYKLPTEAQWEYACRGRQTISGPSTKWHFGNDQGQLEDYAWFDKNAFNIGEKYAHMVGQKKPNPFGLYDMHGNVWEWCSDGYDETYYEGLKAQSAEVSEDPENSKITNVAVLRGGSWFFNPEITRSAYRGKYGPPIRIFVGFRLVRTP